MFASVHRIESHAWFCSVSVSLTAHILRCIILTRVSARGGGRAARGDRGPHIPRAEWHTARSLILPRGPLCVFDLPSDRHRHLPLPDYLHALAKNCHRHRSLPDYSHVRRGSTATAAMAHDLHLDRTRAGAWPALLRSKGAAAALAPLLEANSEAYGKQSCDEQWHADGWPEEDPTPAREVKWRRGRLIITSVCCGFEGGRARA